MIRKQNIKSAAENVKSAINSIKINYSPGYKFNDTKQLSFQLISKKTFIFTF